MPHDQLQATAPRQVQVHVQHIISTQESYALSSVVRISFQFFKLFIPCNLSACAECYQD